MMFGTSNKNQTLLITDYFPPFVVTGSVIKSAGVNISKKRDKPVRFQQLTNTSHLVGKSSLYHAALYRVLPTESLSVCLRYARIYAAYVVVIG